MDYEKKYKESLSRAKGMWDQGMMPERIEYIFPELKESEDEKIREDIYSLIKINTTRELANKYISWLEKQGENISLHKFTFDDVLALQCAMDVAKKVQKDEDLYKQLESLHDRVHDAYWLEKQGEQKEVIKTETMIWHNSREEPKNETDIIIVHDYFAYGFEQAEIAHYSKGRFSTERGFFCEWCDWAWKIKRWCYIEDVLKLD